MATETARRRQADTAIEREDDMRQPSSREVDVTRARNPQHYAKKSCHRHAEQHPAALRPCRGVG
jgi:hypothetical protein